MASNKRFLLLGIKLRNKIRVFCTTHPKSSYFIGKILNNTQKIEVLWNKNVTGVAYKVAGLKLGRDFSNSVILDSWRRVRPISSKPSIKRHLT